MGNTASATQSIEPPAKAAVADQAAVTGEKKKCKACCACPETKKIRDECVMLNGEENCGEVIEKHKQCMRDMGFKV